MKKEDKKGDEVKEAPIQSGKFGDNPNVCRAVLWLAVPFVVSFFFAVWKTTEQLKQHRLHPRLPFPEGLAWMETFMRDDEINEWQGGRRR